MGTPNTKLAISVDDVLRRKAVPLSRAGLYNAIRRGEIPHVKVGRRILIPTHALERWLNDSAMRSVAAGQ